MDYSQAWQRLEHTNTYTQGIPGFQGWFCPISSGFSGYQRLYSFWLESGQKVVNYEVYAKDLGFGSSRIYIFDKDVIQDPLAMDWSSTSTCPKFHQFHPFLPAGLACRFEDDSSRSLWCQCHFKSTKVVSGAHAVSHSRRTFGQIDAMFKGWEEVV